MTNPRTYPYSAWVLLPSFKPKEVELVRTYKSFSNEDYGDLTESGKLYSRAEIFASKRDAVMEGWARVDKQTADLHKREDALDKRKAALRKATAELSEAA